MIRTIDHDGGVRLFILDRPPANAINDDVLAHLASELERARLDDSVRALVITGEGAFFSAGLDLSADLRDTEATERRVSLMREALLGLLTFPKPTVAIINGHAIGAGLILALACDVRLGLDGDYSLGLNEVALGAAYPKVAFEIVRLRLTHAQSCKLFLGAEIHEAKDIVRLGVVEELLPSSHFESTVLDRAARLGAFPREAYAHVKEALVAEAVERIGAETPEEAQRGGAISLAPESVAAWEAQRRKFGKQAGK